MSRCSIICDGRQQPRDRAAPAARAGAATGVLNTGGNLGGFLCQPLVAALSPSGHWDAAFETGMVVALVAAAAWLLLNCERTARPSGA